MPILCGECTLIYPNGDQRRPYYQDEQCEVCGKKGTHIDHDGQTIDVGPVTVEKYEHADWIDNDLVAPFVPQPLVRKLNWIGVDLDGTLATALWTPDNPTSDIGEPIWGNVAKVRLLDRAGYKIFIHTSRGWTDYQLIEQWLRHYEIPFKEIQCGKPLYAAYIDDRAINADELDWWPSD